LIQRVVEACDHPSRVAEGRVLGNVLDALSINPHFAAVIEAVEEFLAGIRQHRSAGFGCRHQDSPFVVLD